MTNNGTTAVAPNDFDENHRLREEFVNVLPIISLFLMMGCAAQSWDHPKGMADFERDHQRCAQSAGQQAMDMDPHTGRTVEQAIDDCLQNKGYVQSRGRR